MKTKFPKFSPIKKPSGLEARNAYIMNLSKAPYKRAEALKPPGRV